jgi:CRP-like cAMP-binding protein
MSAAANPNANSKQVSHEPVLVSIGEGESFKDELCSMIECAQIFNELPRADIEVLAGYARAYEVEKGAAIFREGEKGTFLCIVIEGKVDVLKESDTRERKKITTIRAGKTMGEMSILDDLPHSATTVAAEKTKLVLITRNNFDRMTEQHPILGIKIVRCIARLISLRLRQTTGILLDYLD